MKTFVIRRRNAWKNARELEATAGVSLRIGNDEMADQVRWIRSYVVQEDDGTLGLFVGALLPRPVVWPRNSQFAAR